MTDASWETSSAWRETLASLAESGRESVLFLGSGLHQQAGHRPMNWANLVGQALQDSFVPAQRNHALPLAWEACAMANQDQEACKAEADAASRIAERLKSIYPRGSRSPIVDRLLKLGFSDIVSFNFDQTLESNTDSEVLTSRLLRSGTTRIWYPHGHVHHPREIVLGTRRYGLEIKRLESARKAFWVRKRNETDTSEPAHWMDLVLSRRPIVTLGLGLSPNEWTIWWALSQRARRRFSNGIRPTTTIVLIGDDEVSWLREWRREAAAALRIGVVEVPVAGADRAWNGVLDACAA